MAEVIAPVAVEVPVVPAVPAEKQYSFDELKGLTSKKDLHLLISGKGEPFLTSFGRRKGTELIRSLVLS